MENGEEEVAIRPHQKPQFGAMKGEPKWPEGWDSPMSDDEVDKFLGCTNIR
jgi:hypothetical protein